MDRLSGKVAVITGASSGIGYATAKLFASSRVTTTREVLAHVQGMHALKRIAAPEEIARCVLHLASDAASFVTGTAMLVDGGISINR